MANFTAINTERPVLGISLPGPPQTETTVCIIREHLAVSTTGKHIPDSTVSARPLSPQTLSTMSPNFATDLKTPSVTTAHSPTAMTACTPDVSMGTADTSNPSTSPCAKSLKQREFICAYNDASPCTTGQYTLNVSRKTISDHFGRNKGCTRAIRKWPLFCRKHYQRITYHRALWQARKLELIDDQLDTIERQYPGIIYKIQLKKSEEKRLADFARATAFADHLDSRSLNTPTRKSKSFEAPIQVLQQLNSFLGDQKTKRDCKDTLAILRNMLNNGETKEIPSIEFLPQIPKAPPINTGSPKKSKAVTRISQEGSIVKP